MKVEYLYGQKVADVKKNKQRGQDIVFVSGSKLIYENVLAEPDIKDHVFTHGEFATQKMTLFFRKPKEKTQTKLILDPLYVGVEDATGAVFPHVPTVDDSESIPNDPSPERVAHGPTGPEDDEE